MTKPTHQHQKDTMNTDKKFRPEDEHLYAREKQEFQESEKAEKLKPRRSLRGTAEKFPESG